MGWMAIRVSGQCQKHDAVLLGEIAKWFLQFSGNHHLTTPDKFIPTCRPLLCQTSAAITATIATAAVVVVVATISAILPSAVIDAVALVLLPPPPPSLPLPLLVDCCLLFVSTAITVAAAAPAAIVAVATPAAVNIAVVNAAITFAATGNAVGGGGSAELMG